jgi:hypothetical protein
MKKSMTNDTLRNMKRKPAMLVAIALTGALLVAAFALLAARQPDVSFAVFFCVLGIMVTAILIEGARVPASSGGRVFQRVAWAIAVVITIIYFWGAASVGQWLTGTLGALSAVITIGFDILANSVRK